MKKQIVIICGGPSQERGISLNSARSLYDNLAGDKYELSLLYVNPELKFFRITEAQVYSNTPLDFDYRLQHSSQELTKPQLADFLRSMDLVFPAIHGKFGEDGQLQQILEEAGVNYVGSGPDACLHTANKRQCQDILKENGFYTFPNWVVKNGEPLPQLPDGRYVVKPLHGGSSIGVHYVDSPLELSVKLSMVFESENQAIIEPHATGVEFTVIVLENAGGEPVALLPTEIEFFENKFFDYRKKYLPSGETVYHTPARFEPALTEQIRSQAELAFKVMGMSDFARLDGWVLPDSVIWFSDINGISGMEQNSFLFQQAALLGLSHRQLLDFIINKRISPPERRVLERREDVPIIFGGSTAERQVSIMSGTNVWMKLRSSEKYAPIPIFMSSRQEMFHIPEFLCLQHTVEEIEEKIRIFSDRGFLESLSRMQGVILGKLGIPPADVEEPVFMPKKTTLEEIAGSYKFLFLGLHGGDGENGVFQRLLENLKLPYNGPGSAASKLCMDKFETGRVVTEAKIPGVTVAKKYLMKLDDDLQKTWLHAQDGNFGTLILKPRGDGSSAGVVHVNTFEEFCNAMGYFRSGAAIIPEGAINPKNGRIELPCDMLKEILIEEFIDTDGVTLENLTIQWIPRTDIIEVSVGVLGEKGNLQVMDPGQTIAGNEILSLEEKFMGGTGINLVPPPQKYVSSEAVGIFKGKVKRVAEKLGIEGYSRIDCFMNRKTGDAIIIEVNSLPALTPSTILFQEAVALDKPLNPRRLLETIIELGKKRFK